MRSTIDAKKMGAAIMALRAERSSYIAALAGAAFLALLLIISIITNIYSISALVVDSSHEISRIHVLHNNIKPTNATNAKTIISQLQLFGTAPSGIATATNSNFTLLGIEYSDKNPGNARAIISTNSGDDEIFNVGDKLSGGIIIDGIGPDSVVLLQNGVKQKLSLSWEGNDLISHKQEPVAEDDESAALPGNPAAVNDPSTNQNSPSQNYFLRNHNYGNLLRGVQ